MKKTSITKSATANSGDGQSMLNATRYGSVIAMNMTKSMERPSHTSRTPEEGMSLQGPSKA